MVAKLATYQEVVKAWTVKELLDAHELLDVQHEAEEHYREEARRESPR